MSDYSLIFSLSGAGKSRFAEDHPDKAYDGDVIISLTTGWPKRKHDDKWRFWKHTESPIIALIHAAHATVIGSWLKGPDRPYADVRNWDKGEKVNEFNVTALSGPILFTTNIQAFMDNHFTAHLFTEGKVAAWIPGYDQEKQDASRTVDIIVERRQSRAEKRPEAVKPAVDKSTVAEDVDKFVQQVKHLKLPLVTSPDDPLTSVSANDPKPDDIPIASKDDAKDIAELGPKTLIKEADEHGGDKEDERGPSDEWIKKVEEYYGHKK